MHSAPSTTHQDDAFARHHFFTSDKFMIFEFVIAADEELKFLEHVVAKGYWIQLTNVICLTGYDRTQPGPSPSKKTRWRKKQCLPNLRCQLLVQDKRLHNHCIFEYIMIRPTSASKKIYSRQTLGLPFHCLKLALVVGGKKEAGTHS